MHGKYHIPLKISSQESPRFEIIMQEIVRKKLSTVGNCCIRKVNLKLF